MEGRRVVSEGVGGGIWECAVHARVMERDWEELEFAQLVHRPPRGSLHMRTIHQVCAHDINYQDAFRTVSQQEHVVLMLQATNDIQDTTLFVLRRP